MTANSTNCSVATTANIAWLTTMITDYTNYPPYTNIFAPIPNPSYGQLHAPAAPGTGGLTYGVPLGGGSIHTGGSMSAYATPSFPKNPLVRTIDNGEKFDDCLELLVSDFDVTDETMRFHYTIWVKNFGENFKDYGFVTRHNSNSKNADQYGYAIPKTFVAFGSQTTKDHFLTWFKNYKSIFYKNVFIEDTFIPELDSTRKLSGSFVIDNVEKENTFEELNEYVIDSWSWIVANCYNPVIRVKDTGWIFSSDVEAIHFKMRD